MYSAKLKFLLLKWFRRLLLLRTSQSLQNAGTIDKITLNATPIYA